MDLPHQETPQGPNPPGPEVFDEWIQAPPTRVPSARTAFSAMIAFFLTQMAGFFLVGLAAGIYAASTGVPDGDVEALETVIGPFILYSMLPVFLISGLPVLTITRARAADVLNDGSPQGVGWRNSTAPAILAGLFIGAVFAFSCLLLYSTIFKQIEPGEGGAIAQLANTGPVAQISLALMVVLVAPVVEEGLFRGVMLAGFTRSFGLTAAVFLTSGLFTAAHLPELLRYPPATLGIGGLALLATWLRIQTESLFPAMAVHAGYNGLLVALMLLAPHIQH